MSKNTFSNTKIIEMIEKKLHIKPKWPTDYVIKNNQIRPGFYIYDLSIDQLYLLGYTEEEILDILYAPFIPKKLIKLIYKIRRN